MTNDEAREYFKSKNLTYDDIDLEDINVLYRLLNRYINRACRRNEMSVNSMRISQKINRKLKETGKIIECYLFINSHYFTRRECISFNIDGFIGFAGWADNRNLVPIIKAFVEWCDYLSK